VKKLDLSVLLGECAAAMVGIFQMVNQWVSIWMSNFILSPYPRDTRAYTHKIFHKHSEQYYFNSQKVKTNQNVHQLMNGKTKCLSPQWDRAIKRNEVIQLWQCKAIIPATQEAEAGEWSIPGHPGKGRETKSQKQNTKGPGTWLKW
jgi:hypothetical protein